MKYAIIDIETTGLNPKRDRITEVAILIHDGEKTTDEFISLVNPEMRIPYRIRELTGISDKMVEMAPRFCEIAREVVEKTAGCIFVAHNVHFDYNFIREEFARLGYHYERQLLCTKRLSQKLMPGLRSYSLGNLCQSLDIRVEHRHRAFGDAKATVKLFDHLLLSEKQPESLSLRGIRTKIPKEKLNALPDQAGVYYFHNEEGSIIYIGKSVNIRERILSHFSNGKTKRAAEMQDQIHDVSYELCGSELIALLLESEEVKKHMPRFNRLLRRNFLQWGLYSFEDEKGYIRLEIKRNDGTDTPVTTFSTKKQATETLFLLIDEHHLCQKLSGLYRTKGACFHQQIRHCYGACIGEEDAADYNSRVKTALLPWSFTRETFFIIDKGRNSFEKSVVMVEQNRYCGYGYLPADEPLMNPEELSRFIHPKADHRDARQVIRCYMRQNKPQEVIWI
jgi:DNA polymerase III subunit epsilon